TLPRRPPRRLDPRPPSRARTATGHVRTRRPVFLPIPWGGGPPPGFAAGEPEDKPRGGGGDAAISIEAARLGRHPPHHRPAAARPGPARKPRPQGLARIVGKYDPGARDHRNRALGQWG